MALKKKKITGNKLQRRVTDIKSDKEFQTSRWTIRLKLMVIISTIIGLALFGMVALATIFYSDDLTANVQEMNLKLANVIGINVETSITGMSQNARMIADSMSSAGNSRTEARALQTDGNIVLVQILNQNLDSVDYIINRNFLSENKIKIDQVLKLPKTYAKDFRASFKNQVVMTNVSPGFSVPLIALSVPYASDNSNKIIVIVSKMQSILQVFQTPGLVTAYMVSDDGTIVAHPDNAITLAGKNIKDSPIVKQLQTSQVTSGQIGYKDRGVEFLGSYRKIPMAGLGIIATVNKERAFAGIYRIQRRNIYLMIVFISLAILVTFIFARQLVRPIRKLTMAAKQIAMGNFQVGVVPEYSDEIGLLTDSFNNMSNGLQERENLKESFGRFVNKELAEMSMSGALELGGTRKEIAIFFSDIRGFTSISEKLKPEDVVEFLNEYFTSMVNCINQTHGLVDKFIGDAIMAHWGALKSTGNNTENAVDAGLKMRLALIEFNKGRGNTKKPIIHMGAGINTGPVIAGQIGATERLEYTVIGDAVNLASRVEALTKHFGVDLLITDSALAKVKGIYKIQKMDSIKVKGKSKPVHVFAVLGRADDADAPKDLKALRKMVGIDFKSSGKSAGSFKDAKYESA